MKVEGKKIPDKQVFHLGPGTGELVEGVLGAVSLIYSHP